MQVIDPSQDCLFAAWQRGLLPKSIWNFCNSPREFVFDHLCPGNGDPRRESGARHRLLEQKLCHLCLAVAQENNEIIMVA